MAFAFAYNSIQFQITDYTSSFHAFLVILYFCIPEINTNILHLLGCPRYRFMLITWNYFLLLIFYFHAFKERSMILKLIIMFITVKRHKINVHMYSLRKINVTVQVYTKTEIIFLIPMKWGSLNQTLTYQIVSAPYNHNNRTLLPPTRCYISRQVLIEVCCIIHSLSLNTILLHLIVYPPKVMNPKSVPDTVGEGSWAGPCWGPGHVLCCLAHFSAQGHKGGWW